MVGSVIFRCDGVTIEHPVSPEITFLDAEQLLHTVRMPDSSSTPSQAMQMKVLDSNRSGGCYWVKIQDVREVGYVDHDDYDIWIIVVEIPELKCTPSTR